MIRAGLLVSLLLWSALSNAGSERDNYRYACSQVTNLVEVNACYKLPPPTVTFTLLLDAMNANGMYILGEATIFVNPRAVDLDRVMVHEMVHYILWFNGIEDKCDSEQIARYIAGQPGDKWRVRYGCLKEKTK